MISLLPGSSPAETAQVYGLLAILADPAKVKARLDELVAIAQAAEDANSQAQADRARAEELGAQAKADVEAAAARLAEIEAAGMDVARREQLLKTGIADHAAAAEQFKTWVEHTQTSVQQRLSEAESRERALNERESALTEKEAAVAAMAADLDRRLARIKELAA